MFSSYITFKKEILHPILDINCPGYLLLENKALLMNESHC